MSLSGSDRSDYLLRSAQKIAAEVAFSRSRSEYDRVIRKTQEAVELFLKGRLLSRGIEPAKTHDLTDLAEILADPSLTGFLDDFVYLSEARIPSFYGSAEFIPDQKYDLADGNRCWEILKRLGLVKED